MSFDLTFGRRALRATPLALAMVAIMVGGGPSFAQGGIKDRWMASCAASGGGSPAYCDCTFEAIGSRLTISEMQTMMAIVEAAMTQDPVAFGQMAEREGLDADGINAWDQRMQSLSSLAERECAAFR